MSCNWGNVATVATVTVAVAAVSDHERRHWFEDAAVAVAAAFADAAFAGVKNGVIVIATGRI